MYAEADTKRKTEYGRVLWNGKSIGFPEMSDEFSLAVQFLRKNDLKLALEQAEKNSIILRTKGKTLCWWTPDWVIKYVNGKMAIVNAKNNAKLNCAS